MEHTTCVTADILEAFGLSPKSPVTPLNGGHINDTFLIDDKDKFTLQRISRYVFPSPEDIMENIAGVTAYLRERIGTLGGDPDRETLNIRKTLDGSTLYVDGEGVPWRCMTYVDGARSYETVESPARRGHSDDL